MISPPAGVRYKSAVKTVCSILVLPLLLGLAACTTVSKEFPAMKPSQTAQHFSIERKQVLSADYLLFLPEGYAVDAAKRWPLILFLHGAGERGKRSQSKIESDALDDHDALKDDRDEQYDPTGEKSHGEK